MFGLDWSELALIAAVALVVIGPKDLPRVLRTAGQWAARARSMARDFQRSLEDIVHEADLGDVRDQAQRLMNFDIAGEVKRHVDPDGELRKSLEPPPELTEPLFGAPSFAAAAAPSEAGDAPAAPIATMENTAAILVAQGLAAPGLEPKSFTAMKLAAPALVAYGLAAPGPEFIAAPELQPAAGPEETAAAETAAPDEPPLLSVVPESLLPATSLLPAADRTAPEPLSLQPELEPALEPESEPERVTLHERAAGA